MVRSSTELRRSSRRAPAGLSLSPRASHLNHKTPWCVLLLALAALALTGDSPLVFPSAASAQYESPGGHLGVFFDTAAGPFIKEVPAFQQFQLYVLADFRISTGPWGLDMGGWEAKLEVDPRVTVTSRLANPPDALNFGPGADDFLVGLVTSLSPADSPLTLVTYGCLLLNGDVTDAWVDILSTDVEGSFGGDGPGWITRGAEEVLVPFESWSGALINPRDGIGSIGEVKSAFRER